MKESLLQKRINELDIAIINTVDDKVYITGFYNDKRLLSHIEKGMDNWRSKGIYPKSDISFSNIKNDALFLVMVDEKIIEKHQFTVVYRNTIQRLNKSGPITLTIRKNNFVEQWQIITQSQTSEFHNKIELKDYLEENFQIDFEI